VIEIKIKLSSNKLLDELTAKGHSGFDKKGSDPVCAAVTILLETAFLTLKKLPEIDVIKEDNGKIYNLKIKKKGNNLSSEIRGITLYLITGLQILVYNYNENIKIEIIE
jgi:uncharacterized protein YsxB (DUF464 family)